MKICPECGAEYADDRYFCDNCKSLLEKVQRDTEKENEFISDVDNQNDNNQNNQPKQTKVIAAICIVAILLNICMAIYLYPIMQVKKAVQAVERNRFTMLNTVEVCLIFKAEKYVTNGTYVYIDNGTYDVYFVRMKGLRAEKIYGTDFNNIFSYENTLVLDAYDALDYANENNKTKNMTKYVN